MPNKNFNSGPDYNQNSERVWKIRIKEFETEFTKIRATDPNCSLNQIAAYLSISVRTVYRMLAVLRHMDDPRISNSVTLNQAYGKIKTYYRATNETIEEITHVINSIVPIGDTK